MDDLALAHVAVDAAAALAMDVFARGLTPTWKPDGSPVTDADLEVEALLRKLIALERPGDSFLGEEFGRLGDGDRVWILDPIDGTTFFSTGSPHWRVHVALEVGGVTEVAVVAAPALRIRWWAERGAGAFEAPWPAPDFPPQRLQLSTTATVDDATVDAIPAKDRNRFPPAVALAPASPLALVELVRGGIDAVLVECAYIWDHAPWILLVEEAGGRFTNPVGGTKGDQGGGLYSNANLHDELAATFGYPVRRRSDGR